jgi:hypothetical protein
MSAMLASNSLKQNVVDNIRFDCNFASPGANHPPPVGGGRGARPHLHGHPHGLPQQSPFLADFQQSIPPTIPSETLNPHIAHNHIGNITRSNYNWLQGTMNHSQNLPHSALPTDASTGSNKSLHSYLNL